MCQNIDDSIVIKSRFLIAYLALSKKQAMATLGRNGAFSSKFIFRDPCRFIWPIKAC